MVVVDKTLQGGHFPIFANTCLDKCFSGKATINILLSLTLPNFLSISD